MVPIELKRMLTCGKDFCLLDVLVDNEQAARVAGNEFYRSRWWAYKWLKRKKEIFKEIQSSKPIEGARELINELKSCRCLKAVVSGSSKEE
ncbi:MAG: hypothetical protein WBE68_28200, partial [Candidatus Nitrosopolaris sp.]